MKVKNFNCTITNDDINTITKLLDKINFKSISIDKITSLSGVYKIMGMSVEFETTLSLSSIQGNIIYLDLIEFKIAKMNNNNPIVKKSLDFLISSITSLQGITFNNNKFKIDINEIIKEYLEKENKIKLNELSIEKVLVTKGEIQVLIQSIDFKLLNIQ